MREKARADAAENERAEALRLVANGESAYAGSEICANVISLLGAAGCGRPGTPNTIWAMTKELIARVRTAESALAEERRRVLEEAEAVCKALSASPRGNDYGSIGGAYDDCADSLGALAVGSGATEAQPPPDASGALAGSEEPTPKEKT